MSRVSIGSSVVLWLARGLSVLVVGLVILMIAGERPNPIGIIRSTHGLFLFFPLGMCIGLVLAWRWELLGSLLSLTSMGLFFVMHYLLWGRWLRLSGFLLFLPPAMLFLASWIWSRIAQRAIRAGNI